MRPFIIQFIPLLFLVLIYNILGVFYPVGDPNVIETPLEDWLRSSLLFGGPILATAVGVVGLKCEDRRKTVKFRTATIVISLVNLIGGVLLSAFLLLLVWCASSF